MEERIEDFVTALLDRNVSIFTACTGAGAGLPNLLWQVPGFSSYLEGSVFPYSQAALERFLGFDLAAGNCNEGTAMDMAMQAYMEAYNPESSKEPVGLGLTASVATTKIHRGEHRIHMAVMCQRGMFAKTWILNKESGAKARISDGKFCDELAVILLLNAIDGNTRPYGDATEEAFERLLDKPIFWPGGYRQRAFMKSEVTAIFPGVFNPPHAGHFGAAADVRQRGGEVLFSLCVDPPHKDPVSLADVLKRAKMLRGYPFMVTKGDPLYIDKARRHGKPLVVGVDALLRLFDPKWVPDVEALWDEFARLGTIFYVAGRLIDGEWVSLNEVLPKVPAAYRDRFVLVTGRWDTSSTDLRQGAA